MAIQYTRSGVGFSRVSELCSVKHADAEQQRDLRLAGFKANFYGASADERAHLT